MRTFVCLLFLIALVGCKVERYPVISRDTVTQVRYERHDSIVTLPPDSTVIRAWFECDSLNHVVMTELATKAGQTITPRATFNKGQFEATAKVDSQAVAISWNERHQRQRVTETVIQKVPVEKVISKYPKWLIALAVLGVGMIGLNILKFIQKFK